MSLPMILGEEICELFFLSAYWLGFFLVYQNVTQTLVYQNVTLAEHKDTPLGSLEET